MITILKNEGFLGLYRGFGMGVLREVPGIGLYFGLYEEIKAISNSEDPMINFLLVVNAAGLAGAISWFFSIPQDIVKNR